MSHRAIMPDFDVIRKCFSMLCHSIHLVHRGVTNGCDIAKKNSTNTKWMSEPPIERQLLSRFASFSTINWNQFALVSYVTWHGMIWFACSLFARGFSLALTRLYSLSVLCLLVRISRDSFLFFYSKTYTTSCIAWAGCCFWYNDMLCICNNLHKIHAYLCTLSNWVIYRCDGAPQFVPLLLFHFLRVSLFSFISLFSFVCFHVCISASHNHWSRTLW